MDESHDAHDDLDGRLAALARQIDVPPPPSPAALKDARPHRRPPALVLVAAAVVLLLGIGAIVTIALTRDDTAAVETGPVSPVPGAEELAPTSKAFVDLLAGSGVDVNNVPTGLLDLEGAATCGVVEHPRYGTTDEASIDATNQANRCFLDAHLSQLPAVLVNTSTTLEGDPLITIYRTRGDGMFDQVTDSTRHRYGSGSWWYAECDLLIETLPIPLQTLAADTVTSEGCHPGRAIDDGVVPITAGSVAPAPAWFRDRMPLPVCGVEKRVEELDVEHRRCFAEAARRGEPAELAYGTQPADDGEGESLARWYRSLGDGTFEIIERWHSVTRSSGHSGWNRTQCSFLGFTDAPGLASDLIPTAESDSNCTVLDSTIDPILHPPTTELPMAEPTVTTSGDTTSPQSSGEGQYVDVDLVCGAFELDGIWVLDSGDISGWQPPGERHEGGLFTIERPDRGTFRGDTSGTKTATFRRLPDGEAPDCVPVPR